MFTKYSGMMARKFLLWKTWRDIEALVNLVVVWSESEPASVLLLEVVDRHNMAVPVLFLCTLAHTPSLLPSFRE